MQQNFWHGQTTPLYMLAPMEDVTDTVFREIVLHNSSSNKLHILFTEFTSTDGMCHPIGKERVRHRLKVNSSELQLLKEKGVKLVAQIWGNKPENYRKTIEMIQAEEHPFDGIDINMGCPVKNVVSHGSCSALINQPDLAKEIIQASKEATNLPLSVKTRIGFKKIETESWINHLLHQPIDAIILHGRIQKQMSDGVANWNEILKAVDLRNNLNSTIKIIGNGDISSINEADEKASKYGVNGVMIGRGIFKNPWLFSPINEFDIDSNVRIQTLLYHVKLYCSTWHKTKNFAILKRFFKIYISGFKGASELRHNLMQTNSENEVIKVIENYNTFSQKYIGGLQSA